MLINEIINEPLLNCEQVTVKRRWILKTLQGTKHERNKLLKNPVCHKLIQGKCTQKCSVEYRHEIFKEFHTLSYDTK